ncbi:hypothetical protein TNCV_211881 [Trichonephila clavipes]|uniref:Uncharacterized protein n=1 Tax=Trichonephila clavipes TaxID=2585209 RepID=A0A8X6T5B7_TRICX|nr:hypothetical protein TNCV_211881 [Trichonephila clavipes]
MSRSDAGDAGKNGWKISDFSFRIAAVRRITADRNDRLIVRTAVTAPDSYLSAIKRATCARVSTMIIHKKLIEQNLRSYQQLSHLSLTHGQCRARLKWLLARIMLNGDVKFLATNAASNCALMIIKDVFGDAQGTMPILIWHTDPQPRVKVWGVIYFDSSFGCH